MTIKICINGRSTVSLVYCSKTFQVNDACTQTTDLVASQFVCHHEDGKQFNAALLHRLLIAHALPRSYIILGFTSFQLKIVHLSGALCLAILQRRTASMDISMTAPAQIWRAFRMSGSEASLYMRSLHATHFLHNLVYTRVIQTHNGMD